MRMRAVHCGTHPKAFADFLYIRDGGLAPMPVAPAPASVRSLDPLARNPVPTGGPCFRRRDLEAAGDPDPTAAVPTPMAGMPLSNGVGRRRNHFRARRRRC